MLNGKKLQTLTHPRFLKYNRLWLLNHEQPLKNHKQSSDPGQDFMFKKFAFVAKKNITPMTLKSFFHFCFFTFFSIVCYKSSLEIFGKTVIVKMFKADCSINKNVNFYVVHSSTFLVNCSDSIHTIKLV